jgi:hypothetical protein
MENQESNSKPEGAEQSSGKGLSSSALLASLVAHVRADCVILQEREYIEDGWFIKVIPSQVQLWEIPQYGGEEYLIATFPSITEAYRRAISLS